MYTKRLQDMFEDENLTAPLLPLEEILIADNSQDLGSLTSSSFHGCVH